VNALPLGGWQRWPVNLVALFGCALGSYYLIEQPIRNWGYGISRRATPETAGVVAGFNPAPRAA